MEPFLTAEVIGAVRGAPSGLPPERLVGVSTDSRTVGRGELFVALAGESFDGHAFLGDAAKRGAGAALVRPGTPAVAGLPFIVVADPGAALLELASFQRKRLRAKIVAITGSNGKTTTKDLTAHALRAKHRVVSSPLSFNNQVGVPHTLFLAGPETDVVVLEVGTNHPGEIAALARVIRPDVAAITNVAPAHLEGLGTIEGVLVEKGSLLEHVADGGLAVLNADDPRHEQLRARAKCRVLTVGVTKRADHVATRPSCDLDRIGFHFDGKETVRVPLLGCHNLYNSLMALSIAVELDVPIAAAAAALRTFEGPPMRLEKRVSGARIVLNDAYNANPGSMLAAVKTFASLAFTGRRVLVLGDMLELGKDAERLHREVGEQLSCGDFALVAAVGPLAANVLDGARQHGFEEARLLAYADAESCARDLPRRLAPDDAVLVKGSRRMRLERVVETLLAGGGRGGAARAARG